MEIKLPSSKRQASVATFLEHFRKLYLQEALGNAIQGIDLNVLNEELGRLVPEVHLRNLASAGLRGEFLFPVPAVLAAKPNLLGYYRLVLGYSQKEFFQKSGLGRFKSLELNGTLSKKIVPELELLCKALIIRAVELLEQVGYAKVSATLLHELTLLTLGSQLQGSNNTRIGQAANREVFEIIQQIVSGSIVSASANRLELFNASKRRIVMAFSADPDISLTEEMGPARKRHILAIEIKGGGDKSNIWNRFGEAEKSHLKAKAQGFEGFWTIYNVSNLDLTKAREQTPTTQHFYNLANLVDNKSTEYSEFRARLCSMLGIVE